MKKNIYSTVFFFFLLTGASLYCQDIHFSQFYASPLSVNPANTGNYKGDWRAMHNFRRQWKAIGFPYNTTSIGFDKQFYIFNEHISAGAFIINDNSGPADLTVNKIYISGAYHKPVKGHVIHTGIQIGYVFKSFNIDKLTFPEQWDMDNGKFNPEKDNYENSINNKLNYPDFHTGVVWNKKFRVFDPQVGISLFHFNKPKEAFTETGNRLPVRKVFHSEVRIDLNEKIFLLPKLFYMSSTKANDLLAGTNIGLNLPEKFIEWKMKSVFAGSYFRSGYKRNSDAAIIVAGIHFNRLELGISYDINISDLKTATHNRGAFEISLIYTSLSTILEKITIPCDRY